MFEIARESGIEPGAGGAAFLAEVNVVAAGMNSGEEGVGFGYCSCRGFDHCVECCNVHGVAMDGVEAKIRV
ncbi:hypothetical protein ACFWU5_19350 [Nocardia sp. NPDC058640]|uniref:hypothetical protein n=1 Tax=Nocardia sp. NPDC058640 TaxID=3346571 RepID=UPI00364B97FC